MPTNDKIDDQSVKKGNKKNNLRRDSDDQDDINNNNRIDINAKSEVPTSYFNTRQ